MRFHRFSIRLVGMFTMTALLLSAFSPVALCMYATEEEWGTQEVQTDENGEIVTEESATDENGEVITTQELPPYIIVENTTADPDAPTEAPTEVPSGPQEYTQVTDEYGEPVTDENGEAVTELVTEAPLTDENGEIITTQAPTEPVTEPPVPDAFSENGLLLTIAARDADYGYRIVIPKDCSNETGYAAGLLQSVVQKMTGVLLPIVSDSTKPQEREICLGDTNRTKTAPVGVSENGFYLHTQNERVYLYSLGEQGAIYAVTAFLREECGCNWFAAGQTEIPTVDALTVSAKLSLQRGVCFSYNETFSALTDATFLQMNSLTGGAYTFVTDDGSTARTYLSACEETLGTYFVSSEDYFESHPDYFALYNNERNPAQLCLSSWDVYAAVLHEIEDILRSEWVPSQSMQVICLSLPQNDVICQCAQCAALTAQNGSYAGVLITFLNRISAGLFASGYSNLQIETRVSGTVFTVPTAVTPAHNITVRVSAQDRCVGHALNHAGCAYNRYFVEMLKAWLQLMPTVYVDLPTENKAHTIGIFADMKHLQSDVQTLYYLGADGICAADDPNTADCGPEFRALRIYLLSRLFADPYCNLKEERRAFLKSWYGGYDSMEQILDLLCEHAGDAQGHLFVYSDIENSLTLSAQDIQTVNRLWDEATAECGDGRQLLHTEQSRLAWRFWEACCSVGEFGEDADTVAAQQLIEDLQSAGISRYSTDNATLNLSFLSKTLRPQEWNTPVLTLLKPYFDAVRKVFVAAAIFALLILAAVALKRRKPLFLIPLWAFAVVCAVVPWHMESVSAQTHAMTVLTGIVLLAFLALLCAFAVYAKYDSGKTLSLFSLFSKKEKPQLQNEAQDTANEEPDETDSEQDLLPDSNRTAARKHILLQAGISSAVLAVSYFVLAFLPLYANVSGEQIAPLAILLPCIVCAVSSWFLTVRFIRNRK